MGGAARPKFSKKLKSEGVCDGGAYTFSKIKLKDFVHTFGEFCPLDRRPPAAYGHVCHLKVFKRPILHWFETISFAIRLVICWNCDPDHEETPVWVRREETEGAKRTPRLFNSQEIYFWMLLETQLLHSIFTPSTTPSPARSLPYLTLSKILCPLRDFAPPKLKVFRRACSGLLTISHALNLLFTMRKLLWETGENTFISWNYGNTSLISNDQNFFISWPFSVI